LLHRFKDIAVFAEASFYCRTMHSAHYTRVPDANVLEA